MAYINSIKYIFKWQFRNTIGFWRSKFFIFVMVLIPLAGNAASEMGEDVVPIDDGLKVGIREEPSHVGFAPIVAYTPTYHLITGAAAFAYPKVGRHGLDTHLLVVTLPDSGKIHTSFSQQDFWNTHWGYNLDGVYTNFWNSYYGEGDNTPNRNLQYNQRYYRAHEGILYDFNPEFSVEAYVETRVRIDLGQIGNGSALAPNENRSAAGVVLTWDTRDSVVNSHTGHYLLAQAQGVFGNSNSPGFGQLELEGRQFFQLPDRFVVAMRSEAAGTTGPGTYNYRYNLGGLERLRGYYHNRFRGNQYYLVGGEIRRDLWGDYLQIVVFTDAGDIRDQGYLRPRTAYGAGLRIGLPPDWDMKFRIDFAQGDDQSGIFATFGQAF